MRQNIVLPLLLTVAFHGYSQSYLDSTITINYQDFLYSDIHGISQRLNNSGQGNYSVDKERSGVYLTRTKAFAENTELEALVTFAGSPVGEYIQDVTPDAKSVTVHLHHSFIALPDDNYQTREFHPYSGFWKHSYVDYAVPIDVAMEKKFIPRHRLAKKNPKADLEMLRGTFTLAGLVLSLFIVYSLVNWKFYDVQAAELGQLVVDEEEEDIIPITQQNTPPPPPPPPPAAPEVIEIVEDEVEVEDIEIDTEIDVDEVVEVFEEEEEVVEEEVFTIVESMPEFPGGQKKLFEYLGKSIKFPPAAKANGISGKVYVNFTIGKDGGIRDIKVLRGVHDLLDKEAVRVVKAMPKWKAGKQRGKTVSVSYNLPINFVLR